MSPNLNKRNNQSKRNEQAKKTKIAPYVGFFTVGFILANTIAIIIQSQFALNSYLVMALSITVGAYIAVHKFIKHHACALTGHEINRLSLASVGMIWLLSALYLSGLWIWVLDAISRDVLTEMTLQQPAPLLGALLLMIVMSLIVTRLSIWGFNRLLMPK